MTDEEMAHAVVFWIPGLDDEWRNSLLRRIAADFAAIRADQREIDAGIAEVTRRDLPRPQTSPEAVGTYAFNNGCSSAAAAIRKGGET